jgi:hypothetical protein
MPVPLSIGGKKKQGFDGYQQPCKIADIATITIHPSLLL